MIKDRIVILAKGAPNRLKDGRETQCAIAVSPHLGLIRIYPLHPFENMDVKIWSVCDIEMEKHDKDTRDETYKPSSIKSISKMDKNLRSQQTNYLANCMSSSDQGSLAFWLGFSYHHRARPRHSSDNDMLPLYISEIILIITD